FYARYQEQATGAKKTFLGTQFEATDARRFFPCWDEPSFRATFQLTVLVPENWMAVSNMPVERETPNTGTGASSNRALPVAADGREGPPGPPQGEAASGASSDRA